MIYLNQKLHNDITAQLNSRLIKLNYIFEKNSPVQSSKSKKISKLNFR